MRKVPAVIFAICSASVLAAPQADLSTVRRQIQEIERGIRAKEVNRHEALDALKASEQAVSEARRKLNQLQQHKQESENERARVQKQITLAEKAMAQTRQRIGRILAAQYRQGDPDPLQTWLAQNDPHQAARDRVYHHHLALAQHDILHSLAKQQNELAALSQKLAEETQYLQKISQNHRQQTQKFEQEKQSRAKIVAQLSEEIRQSRQAVGRLQQDEQRLTRLLRDLHQKIEAQRKQASSTPEKIGKVEKSTPADKIEKTDKAAAKNNGTLTAEDVDLRPRTRAPIRSAEHEAKLPFAAQKSGMRLPVAGQVVGQFGGERGAGARWRGVFIQTHAGRNVRAIASGRVVYANWLRGFGNMIIVDHGDSFMSIYGSAEALLKQSGERVKQGEAIATTGASGGSELTGIYFELRHKGEPINPMKWAAAAK